MSIYFIAELLAAWLPLIPVFLLLDRCLFQSRRKTFLFLVFALYLTGVYLVVGLPNVTYFRFDPHVNLIPFRDLLTGLVGTVLNVVLFLPLGFFLRVLWKEFQDWRLTVRFGFFMSLAIEALQIFTFRATDVNDLMTNTLGTCLGWWVGRWAVKLVPSLAMKCAKRDLAMVFCAAAGVMFFVHPLLCSLIYSVL